MAVTLRQLEVLVAVLDRGGFGAAADQLTMSQSSVSHSLASLEREVDGALVERTTPVRGTPLGEALIPHARAMLAAMRGFQASAAAHHDAQISAPIGLGVPPTAARGLLPNLLVA
ncbi:MULTISPECIES: LysR family transcriptional regulator [unclassified Aeromicrobium]|uniref:LysR family transcriptional regulator n=1 Tax=unclassified Aeromicrobium TaxID=2633570 RepID=UPI00396B4706